MKKIFIFLLLAISSSSFAAQVDPMWRLQLSRPEQLIDLGDSLGLARALTMQRDPLIWVIVKSSNVELTAQKIRNSGGKVRSVLGDLITAGIPSSVIENEVVGWAEAEYIEAAKPIKQLNNLADADTSVTVVQAGTDLPYGYDGTGVIIGILDTGIDLTHPAFKSTSGKTRILYLWDQTDSSGPGPSEIESPYGTEYTQAQIEAGTVPETDTNGHGTHVAGTSGGRDSVYSGVAPKASFIIVKYDFAGNLADAANYIFQKAAELGMPAVVNMSLGSDSGPHDGTTLEEQALNSLVSESAGRSIVVAGGNSGDSELSNGQGGGYHARFGVASGDVSKAQFNVYDNSESQYIDIWGEQGCAIELSIDVWNSGGVVAGTGWIANGLPSTEFTLADLAVVAVDRSVTNNSQNGKWNSLVSILTTENYSTTDNYFSLNVRGVCSFFDAWAATPYLFIYDTSGGGWYPGDNSYTIGFPASAANIVGVGSYSTRNTWTDSSGQVQTYDSLPVNSLSYFSSRGPVVDPATQGTKPNITGPGAFLISARSADSDPSSENIIDAQHVAMAGTSMATPHVTGIVALMLQAYPRLSYDEIMSYLQNTARADSYVGATPNSDWGYGKVDAVAAVSAVVTDYPPQNDPNLEVDGVTAGETTADYAANKISINFPRAVDEATINSNNLFLNILATGSSLSSSSAWTPAPCDPEGELLPSTVSLVDTQTAEITLSEAIGLGDFALCLTPNVKDTDGNIFWGKTVQFGTSLPNGGCLLVHSSERNSSQPLFMLLSLLAIMSVARIYRRYYSKCILT